MKGCSSHFLHLQSCCTHSNNCTTFICCFVIRECGAVQILTTQFCTFNNIPHYCSIIQCIIREQFRCQFVSTQHYICAKVHRTDGCTKCEQGAVYYKCQ